MRGGSMDFGDLQTASRIEATARKGGIQHLVDITNSHFELPKEP